MMRRMSREDDSDVTVRILSEPLVNRQAVRSKAIFPIHGVRINVHELQLVRGSGILKHIFKRIFTGRSWMAEKKSSRCRQLIEVGTMSTAPETM